jgi:hypothetical protein
MKVKLTLLVPLFLNLVFTHTSFANESTEALVRKAVSENASESSLAIAELRSQGPAGLEALRGRYIDEIERHIADPSATISVEWQHIAAALDAVSQQKDSYISGL